MLNVCQYSRSIIEKWVELKNFLCDMDEEIEPKQKREGKGLGSTFSWKGRNVKWSSTDQREKGVGIH